jgi:hypothetical protein
VDDCVQEEALLDVADYVLEPSGKRRGRPSLTEEERRLNKNKRAGEKRKEMKERGKSRSKAEAKTKSLKRAKYVRPPSPHEGPRSPSPPPDHTRQAMVHGRYRYTKQEHDYMLQYFQFCLERDPLLSQTAFSNKLHRKGCHFLFFPLTALMRFLDSNRCPIIRPKVGYNI